MDTSFAPLYATELTTAEWTLIRPPLAPAHTPLRDEDMYDGPDPKAPRYVNNPAKYDEDLDTWIAIAYGIKGGDATLRRLENEQANADFRRTAEAADQARVAASNSNATLTERLRLAEQTGRTPDGRPMPTRQEDAAQRDLYRRASAWDWQ